jgi:ABC-type tungstate transport system substrate-binding protein
MSPWRHIDWKLLLFAFLACYAVPWVVASLLLSALIPSEGVIVGWRLVAFNSYLVLYFLCMPFGAGYFTAKFAKNRPQLHVLLVVALGVFGLSFVRSSSLEAQVAAAAVSLAMAALGAFILIRGRSRET